MNDDLRPRGAVMAPCSTCPRVEGCGPNMFWVDALDPRLPDGPFQCMGCAGYVLVRGQEVNTYRWERRVSERQSDPQGEKGNGT